MNLPTYVTLERTRNRHSRAILQGDTIVIRLGRFLSHAEEERHIQWLVAAMERVQRREKMKTRIDPFRALLHEDGEHQITLADGTIERIHRTLAPRTTLRFKNNEWLLGVARKTPVRDVHRLLWRALSKHHLARITARVHAINTMTFRFPISSVQLRYAKTQWGSCSRRGNVSLNPALLFVPDHLLTYVIIHELAHIAHAHHGKRFWAAVESVLPNFRDCIREIRGYRISPL